jgi:hypothetical protein
LVLPYRIIVIQGGEYLKLLRTKLWGWYDIGLLKWGVLLFGMIAGAYFQEFVMKHVWLILAAAVLLVFRPAVVYFKD